MPKKRTQPSNPAPRSKSRSPVKKSKRAVASNLMPRRASAARKKLEVYKLAMFVEGLAGFPEHPSRTVSPNTNIFELQNLKMTRDEQSCLLAMMRAEEAHMPKGGAAMRYRIELAAVTLAMVIHQSYAAAEAGAMGDPEIFAEVMTELAVKRAKEVWADGPTTPRSML